MQDHWLTTAAEKGGLGDASGSGLPTDKTISEAWQWICDFLKCTPGDLTAAVAKAFHLEVADLTTLDHGALSLVPRKTALSLRIVPLHVNDRDIVVATAEPIDFEVERELEFVTGRRVVFHVADPDSLDQAIHAAYSVQRAPTPLGVADLEAAYEHVQPDPEALDRAPAHTRDPATVKICRLILSEAVKADATEIHLSLGPSAGRIQYRVHGHLKTVLRVPIETMKCATDRIRGMAETGATPDDTVQRISIRVGTDPYEIAVHPNPDHAHNLVMGLTGQVPEIPTAEVTNEESEGHILVVDDDEADRVLVRTILEKHGFRVSEADDGGTALSFLDDSDDVDGIILDLTMTDVDGMEVLKSVRASRTLAALPVVILTASPFEDDEQRLLTAGADDYLRKPIDPDQAIDRIKAVMRRAQDRETLL